jgi:hypothetical protein
MNARRLILAVLCTTVGAMALGAAPALAVREHFFIGDWGSEGSGPGQFFRPAAVAVNSAGLSLSNPAAGDVYVIDIINGRVEYFNATGGYLGQFNGSGTLPGEGRAAPTGQLSFPGIGEEAAGIAVDSSGDSLDPSAGDVYVVDGEHDVVDKFSATGEYIGQLTGTPSGAFGEVRGVAVGPEGGVWVYGAHEEVVDKFNDALQNAYLTQISPLGGGFGGEANAAFAVDSLGDMYIAESSGDIKKLAPNGAASIYQQHVDPCACAQGVALEESTGYLYVDQGHSIAEYRPLSEGLEPSGVPLEVFGAAQFIEGSSAGGFGRGVGVNSASNGPGAGVVYAPETVGEVVNAYALVEVSTGAPSGLTGTSATLQGSVSTYGRPATLCRFEYGTSAGLLAHTAACSKATPFTEPAATPVGASVGGLSPGTTYYYRLDVVDGGTQTVHGEVRSFTTPLPVQIESEFATDVAQTSATIAAQLNPGGAETHYHFEYGPQRGVYTTSVPVPAAVLAATGLKGAVASVHLQGLEPDTTYHYRVVAGNILPGSVVGEDHVFRTQSVPTALVLPDGRAWEQVSPQYKNGSFIHPEVDTELQAAAGGGAITYGASGPTGSGIAGNDPWAQLLSTRGPDGWSTVDLAVPNAAGSGTWDAGEYRMFSSDLSLGLVQPIGETPLSAQASERTIYLREDAGSVYTPLVSAANVPAGTKFAPPHGLGAGEEDTNIRFEGGSPSLGAVVFRSLVALTPNAIEGQRGTSHDGSQYKENLYEWVGGTLRLVSVLPEGDPEGRVASETKYQAFLGRVEGGLSQGREGSNNVRNAVSADGSRVFWSLGTNNYAALFMTDMVTGKSVEIGSGDAEFQTASSNGSRVFFTNQTPYPEEDDEGLRGDLYVYDVETGSLTDLGGGVVGGVNAAGEEGSYVYFVSTAVLGTGAVGGQDNLYVAHESGGKWTTAFIAGLAGSDETDWGSSRYVPGLGDNQEHVVWLPQLSAEASPNGRYLAFMSTQSLTGYDNVDAVSGARDTEVYLYDAALNHLVCVSCNPTGARPVGVLNTFFGMGHIDNANSFENETIAASVPMAVGGQGPYFHQPRYLDDSGRVFFNAEDPLVAQATNGVADVYEYEPDGVGSCASAAGCVALISSGTAATESAFLDASVDGEDAFFLTSAQLVPGDRDTAYDVYDAHVCSVAVPCVTEAVPAPACVTADSCRAAPGPQPTLFGAPPSATFSGTGNLAPSVSAPVVVKPSVKRAQKLAGALRACRKRPRKRRAVCEARARKAYGASKSSGRFEKGRK